MTDDVLSQKFRWLLTYRMLHTINTLWLAATCDLRHFLNLPVHSLFSWVVALGCSLGLIYPYLSNTMLAPHIFYLPVVDHCFQPDLPMLSHAHTAATRFAVLLNDSHCMDCTGLLPHEACHTPFAVSLRFISHTCFITREERISLCYGVHREMTI